MRKIKEILRLKYACGLSERQIAESCRLGKTTVGEYLQRAEAVGLSWPLPADLDEEALEARLFARPLPPPSRVLPDWAEVQRELKRKGVTRFLLWQEYKERHPEGIAYPTFTVLYRQWAGKLDVVMRQEHKAGEKLFVDYAGMTLPITDPGTGEVRQGQVFVATLGASNYTYAEVSLTQNLEDWLASHRRALEFFGGVPELVVPDNLKVGVKSPCRYEPEANPSYAELAAHYGFAVLPARVRKPRDKAKVETGVQIVERRILAPLRDRSFFSVGEANKSVWELLASLNEQPFQKLQGSRQSLFEELDRPALKPLPAEPYVLASWKKARVNIDYHIEIDGHYYSVPHQYARQQIEVRLTATTLEVFVKDKRLASHAKVADRARYKGRHTTIPEHMPEAQRRHGEWSPGRPISWAEKIGEHTALVVKHILESRPHPEQGFRSCLGIMRLSKSHPPERVEAACRRAVKLKSYSYQSIASILKHNLDQQPLPKPQHSKPTPRAHRNLRGAGYYQG
jgi:transposase